MIKNYVVYILLGLVLVSSSCLKGPQEDSSPIIQPQGSFSGQFMKEHLNPLTKVRDTVKTNVQLLLSGSNFQLSADAAIHAASNGTFEYNRTLLGWKDVTYTSSNNLNVPPFYLNGVYAYVYDGSNLNFSAYNDTIKYTYTLKKQ